jgi:chromosome segregation ATPase
MNALSILERELEQEEALLREELARLAALLGVDPATPDSLEKLKARLIELNRNLAQSSRQGEVPEGTLEHLKQTVADKLKVASPRYLERYE